LTEGVLMRDAEAGRRSLLALKEFGFALAIDDFGTGYCSSCDAIQGFLMSPAVPANAFRDMCLNGLRSELTGFAQREPRGWGGAKRAEGS
jgi:EAL domain-containing protein (putative c-di-GMP-specific phosphodiesterase class I)